MSGIERRRFLQVLASGVVGLSLVDIEWIPTAIQRTQPLSPGHLTGLEQITAALARAVGQELGVRGIFVPGDYRLGDEGMTEHVSVDIGLDDQAWARGVEPERTLLPAAAALANLLRDRDVQRFGALPLPGIVTEALVASDQASGVTVRGIREWTIGTGYTVPVYADHDEDVDEDDLVQIGECWVDVEPRWMTRFDILGGR